MRTLQRRAAVNRCRGGVGCKRRVHDGQALCEQHRAELKRPGAAIPAKRGLLYAWITPDQAV